jgi:hypothetical protein
MQKRQGMHSLLVIPEGTSPANIFSPGRLILGFWLPKYFVSLEAKKFVVICYSSNKKTNTLPHAL